MLAAGLWMKLRKRRRCGGTARSQGSAATSELPADPLATSADDLDDTMGYDLPSDDDSEDAPVARGPVRSKRVQPRPAMSAVAGKEEGEQADGEAGTGGPRPRKAILLKSVFEGRPPVVLFTYTSACCAKQRPLDRSVPADEEGPRMFYCHTDAIHQYNAVINILRQGGLYRVRAETYRWTVMWSLHPTLEQLRRLSSVQRANHYPGSQHLGRKDLLWKNIARMQRKFGKEYEITPQGYILPKAYTAWEAARLRQTDMLWIWKPCSQSCGRGIKVLGGDMTKEASRELAKKRGIIQKYVPSPLLIGGRKFDMRIYVVVVSYDPLKVYIYDEGLVRFATEKYSESVDTLHSRMMHLTNYSVNKASPAFVQNDDAQFEGKEDAAVDADGQPLACKWSLSELQTHFKRVGIDYDAMFDGIKDLAIKTLIAVEEPLKAEWAKGVGEEDKGWCARGPGGGGHRASCFEAYGFDVLVDTNLKPWLLEVNICPSLSSGSPLDKRIKTKLVADVLTLVGVHPPQSLWKLSPESVVWPNGQAAPDSLEDKEGASGCTLSAAEMEKRTAKLAATESSAAALALFDEVAWELVLESHDEEMRSGGLQRIYPAANGATYAKFFVEESYCNMVLRKWHEAGGAELFRADKRKLLPPWVPKQVCFTRT
eukprot:CAMPEP_0115095838 /NCGR_PEP_ID=MMETSP0227-20121206/29316_1 /TAXON_ID=89957 /ORGANISM="Polarella glacialis, Strain CCMP 1383" /LENGTH=653 /DNA_ID=CAMNT_0002489357 /DNA_START=141 /DNA_END=2102 /DNA_ORIENTATION=+